MRRFLLIFFAALICATSMEASPAVAVNGKLPNAFSVSANKKVWFSQGNLQYVGSWQFASNQWDYFGNSQSNNHRDLFGWGTGNAPNKVSIKNDDYAIFTDWGTNAITNGGNTANAWRTLTNGEWVYLLNSRSGIRYAKAVVNGIYGLIILPDDWSASYYALSNTNNGEAEFTSNSITSANWTNSLEAHGAVFLPITGFRLGDETKGWCCEGYYWSATINGVSAYCLWLELYGLQPNYEQKRNTGLSVRLVSETAPPARVATAPTAKSGTITYNGSGQALFNTGTASGGTMKYQVTTTNSKPGKNSGTWSNSISTATTAGTYYLWYYVKGDANHLDTDVAGSVTKAISKATPTVTAPTPKSLTYTGSAQALLNTGSTTGGTLQYKLGSGSWGTSIPTATAAGNYTVYYKVVGNSNYNAVAEQSVSVTINKAPLTCTADNKSVTYGDAAPTYSATYSGWVNSETQAVLGGSLAFACDYSAGSDVDDYTITPSGVTATNYAITFVPGTLTVNPAPLTCTADNKSVTYGDAAPTYTATYSGWVNSETQAVLTGTLAFACDYSAGSNVDDYTITPSGVSATNYDITFNTGTLTVNKADAVITDVPAAVEGLVYTGAAQTLISAGTATGGELQYKVDASAWSTDLPQATAIGDHTVYYKVVGDGNHNSIDESSFTVSIAAVTVLYDNTDPTTDIAGMVEAGEEYDLTVSRTIYADGYFNTICLPFAVSAGELSNPAHPLYGYKDLKAFSGAEVTGSGQNLFINIYVEDATEIAAGVPYLISYPGNRADILNPTFPAAVCTATTPGAVAHDGVTFQGMFAPVHITTYAENTTEDYLFLGENNRLLWPNDDGSSMRGFRAYFIIHRNNIPAAAAPRGTAARIMQRDNTATGIEQLQGDEVQSTKLLRDGQLIIIRNGVEYNANGQMLK